MPHLAHPFTQIAVILAIASSLGAIAVWLKQPLIMAFIAVGILIGPSGFSIVSSTEEVELLAELGIAVLLFVVGLKLEPNEINAVGSVAVITAVGQMALTGGFGYLLCWVMGMSPIAAFYVAIALTFSSTIIIVKLLSDKKEIDALHSRIAVGVLIVQDIAVVLLMIILSAFGDGEQSLGRSLLFVSLRGAAFLGSLTLITKFILPKLLHGIARSTELLLIFAITWAIVLASVGDFLGFSKEVGAFMAGVSLAATPYRLIIAPRLVSLRDFLLLFFFINLGIHIEITDFLNQLFPALILSAFVLITKPIMVMALVGMLGYKKYTSVITSLSLGQISEFSLILAGLGVSLGHISSETSGLITLIALITMGLSTYMILRSSLIYERFSPWFNWVERKMPHKEDATGITEFEELDVIVFGLGRYGGSLIQDLEQLGVKVLGVDFDPELVNFWRSQGVMTFYGDAEDPEFPAVLPLNKVYWIISTLPGLDMGLKLLHHLKHHNYTGKIALTSHTQQESYPLQKAGADLVLMPFRDAAVEAARVLHKNLDFVTGSDIAPHIRDNSQRVQS
ncbi:transporter, CPA2 family [[Leptolyngbya] sp. PCC 7376]|uniref:cation:proton antiporter n=1 Tax=[Leptolyngbya] sp. PCC 7376 TaxID=111781 RepID=UPI00029EE80D|nr:cation:proton antiporter [[Leptolyngbya] sp. PCC 7376]AFY39149.1 transporter, CPA2 family [[Leptolyngbya] sp. PCC 7376]